MGMLNDVKSKNKLKAAQNWLKMAENAKTPEKQVEYYTKALDANPYNAEAWFRKGRVLEKIGNFEEAKRCFDLATEIDPDYQGLVGKKPYDAEPSPKYAESPSFPENRMSGNLSITTELEGRLEEQPEEEWLAESHEWSGSRYKPPVGSESIFSNLGSQEDDVPDMDAGYEGFDSGELPEEAVQDLEILSFAEVPHEETLQADVSSVGENETIVNTAITTEPSKESFWKEASSQVSELKGPEYPGNSKDVSMKADIMEKRPAPVKQAEVKPLEESKLQSQYQEVQPVVSGTGKGDYQNMDIRIPISETLKFWAVGLVTMLIAFKMMAYI